MTNQAIFRIRKSHKKGEKPKKYQCTYEIVDEGTQQVMAICDLIGTASFSTLTIIDNDRQSWIMSPNRRIMPSRWAVADPGQNVAVQFDQKILGKLINPIYKVAFALLDDRETEKYRLVDPRTSIPDRIFGVSPGEWVILDDDRPVAKLGKLPRQTDQPEGKGLFGRLKKAVTGSDDAVVSAGSNHLLPAPVALGMFMLFKELTDTSAA
ncbi:MAG: hypothetical protein ABFS45_15720 [Pseudomonadota bacterium]